MSSAPTEPSLPATPARLRGLAGSISPEALRRAIELSTSQGDPASWSRFASRSALFLGAGLLLAGVICFFAYNWAALGRFAKLGALQGAITVSAVIAARRLADRLTGQILLAIAAALVGPLLAVHGQVYQLGADRYQLFIGWAALVLPWVVVGRFAPLWLGLFTLLDVALVLYFEQVHPGADPLILTLTFFALNAAASLGWELIAEPSGPTTARWGPRLLAIAAILALTLAGMRAVQVARFHFELPQIAALATALIALPLIIRRYGSTARFDLIIVTGSLISAIALVTAALCELLLRGSGHDAFMLLIGFAVLGQGALAAWWLRRRAAAARATRAEGEAPC